MARRFGRARRGLREPKQVAVKLRLPFLGEIAGTWEPAQAERHAAWELYVELITRVTVVELRPGEGLIREALTSLYTIFGSTREILRKYGPELAPRTHGDAVTFGDLSMAVLNGALRPLLATWHPALAAWEAQRPDGIDPVQHERNWERLPAMRSELAATRAALADLARVLADVAGAAYLLPIETPETRQTAGGGAFLSITSPIPPTILTQHRTRRNLRLSARTVDSRFYSLLRLGSAHPNPGSSSQPPWQSINLSCSHSLPQELRNSSNGQSKEEMTAQFR